MFGVWCLVFSAQAENFNLFVLAGQSNMQGRAHEVDYPQNVNADNRIAFIYSAPTTEGILLGFDKYFPDWNILKPQNGHFGPEVTFSRDVESAIDHVAIFKYSASGTSLYKDWGSPGMGGLLDNMFLQYVHAYKSLRLQGHEATVRGLIWVQGESDAETAEMSAQYYFRLKTLIQRFRELVGVEHLPVVIGVDEQHPFVIHNPEVLSSQLKLAFEDPCIIFVSMKELPKADETHLTVVGLEQHGHRLFLGWQNLMNRRECVDSSFGTQYLLLQRQIDQLCNMKRFLPSSLFNLLSTTIAIRDHKGRPVNSTYCRKK